MAKAEFLPQIYNVLPNNLLGHFLEKSPIHKQEALTETAMVGNKMAKLPEGRAPCDALGMATNNDNDNDNHDGDGDGVEW